MPASPQIGSGITPVQNSATGAASALTATLPAVAGHTNYLNGFDVTGGGATSAALVAVTVTGCLGGTLNYSVAVIAGATLGVNTGGGLSKVFDPPLPASGPNVAIAVTVGSFGTGNSVANVNAYGSLI